MVPMLTPERGYEYLLILPCDMPFLHADVPKRLLAALRARANCEIVYAATAVRAHYLCAALRVSVLSSVSIQLDNQHRAVRTWYASRSSAPLLFSGELANGFLNINDETDLAP